MATLRDQVEAYSFASRRQVLALLQGDDTLVVDPRRRINRSTMGGLLISIAIMAAVGVAGFLTGGSAASLPKNGVIIDSSTGGAYVLVGKVLHPALNLASARLIAGKQQTTVSGETLRSIPRGLPVGIAGAPDQLPPSGRLSHGAWSVCTVAPQATSARPRITVSVGAAAPATLPGNSALPVRAPDGTRWLLAAGQRFQVSAAAATLLELDRVPAVPVVPQVLALVPQGPDLQVPRLAGAGRSPSVKLPFTAAVGDVVEVDVGAGGTERYVVLPRGVAPIGSLAAALLSGGSSHIRHATPDQLAQAPSVPASGIPQAWPGDVRLARPPAAGEPLCVTYAPGAAPTAGAWPVRFAEPTSVPLPAHARAVTASSGGGLPTVATGVAVPPGGGALVRATASGGIDANYQLVTDTGLRYPFPSSPVVSRLGYSTSNAVSVPLPFVQLLPSGPGLDPKLAALEYAGHGPASSPSARPSH